MAWKPEKNNKKTSQGRRNIKTSSMNKNKRKSFKPYRGQGKAKGQKKLNLPLLLMEQIMQ